MNIRLLFVFLFLAFSGWASAIATNVNLGTAGLFAVLAGSSVTNTGNTTINGDVGVSPYIGISGFPPGIVTGGTEHFADNAALQAQADLATAYTSAATETCDTNLTGSNLGGLTLVSGVYCFNASAELNGVLTLNTQGNPNAMFLFQVGNWFMTTSSSSVVFANGGQSENIFWQVGRSATLGAGTSFTGTILAFANVTLDSNATIDCGRALARFGAVTMDTNNVSIGASGCGSGGLAPNAAVVGDGIAPESDTMVYIGIGSFFGLIGLYRRRRGKKK